MKIVIAGAPKVGKTTLANKLKEELNHESFHTDDLIGKLPWGEDSKEVSNWFDKEGDWIVEGVTTVRALRKWLDTRPQGKPCDVLYFRMEPRIIYTAAGQGTMAKGINTVWQGIISELTKRGVKIEKF